MTICKRTAVFVALCLLLVACGGGKKKAAPTTTTPTTAAPTTTAAPAPVYPLTGLPAADPGKAARPALVVKIDNADGDGRGNQARPQTGLNQADVVYEEKVEGAVTRLAAIFQSQDSDPVGPIRSARSTDVAVFSPLNHPLFAWSGANPTFAAIIHDSPIVDVGYDAHSEVYGRNDDDHVAPHDLFSSTPDLYSLAPPGAVAPPALFQYRKPNEPVCGGAQPVGAVHLDFGGGGGSAPVDYGWDAARGGFGRSQRGSIHADAAGVQIAPANVIVQFTDYIDTGITDVVGTPVPEAQLVGTGRALIMSNGGICEATWTKTAPEAVPTYVDAAGKPVKLTPGQTFVELLPNDGGTFSVS